MRGVWKRKCEREKEEMKERNSEGNQKFRIDGKKTGNKKRWEIKIREIRKYKSEINKS